MQLLGRGGPKGQMEKANLQSKRQSPAKQKAQALTKVECGYPKEGGALYQRCGCAFLGRQVEFGEAKGNKKGGLHLAI